MKVSPLAKIFFLFFCLSAFSAVNFVQEKPQVVVFYKFDAKEIENSELLSEKLKEFIERLLEEPETTKGFINIAGNSKLAEK